MLAAIIGLAVHKLQTEWQNEETAKLYVDFTVLVILWGHSFLIYRKKPKIDDVTVNTEYNKEVLTMIEWKVCLLGNIP